MTTEDHGASALLWAARISPVEFRHILLAMTGLFGLVGIASGVAAATAWQPGLVTAAACLASVGLTCGLVWRRDRPMPGAVLAGSLLLAGGLLVVAFLVSGVAFTVFATGLPFAFLIAWTRPWWLSVGVALIAVGGAAAARAALADGASPMQEGIGMTALLGAAAIGFVGASVGWQIQLRLDQHHADQRELALVRERLRFATDLHDIQGHTLLAIKLKAELARRSLERHPERAQVELSDIEELAAEADGRTRDLAQGYRTLTLAAEVANAERLLGAAGVAVTVDRKGTPGGDADELFAALVREAASNILRHSDARTVRMRLSDLALSIENDGAHTGRDERTGRQTAPSGGSGLAGLQRRFADRGGAFTWSRDGDVFRVAGETGEAA
jgi:two-component system sensor histidine kinase DesK